MHTPHHESQLRAAPAAAAALCEEIYIKIDQKAIYFIQFIHYYNHTFCVRLQSIRFKRFLFLSK